MNGYEQVSLGLPGALGSRAMRQIVIAIPDQDGLHAGLRANFFSKESGNAQHDVLFAHPSRTRGAGILAAVPGVDGDHHGPPAGRIGAGHAPDRRRRRHRRSQIDDQPVSVNAVGIEHEAVGMRRLIEVEHHAQHAAGTGPGTQFRDESPGFGEIGGRRHSAVVEIDDQPVGVLKTEYVMGGGPVEVEDHARGLRTRPESYAFNFVGLGYGGQEAPSKEQNRHQAICPSKHCCTPLPQTARLCLQNDRGNSTLFTGKIED